jgi:beta-lactamase class A
MRRTWLYALCLCLLVVGCSGARSDNSSGAESNQTNKPQEVTAKKANGSAEALQIELERIVQSADGRVGVAATLLETGEAVAIKGNERFPMQSVYKFPIGMAVLNQVDQGKLKLDERVRVEKSDFVGGRQHSPVRDRHPDGTEMSVSELLRLMVSQSDGTACDVLLKLVGGPTVVAEYLRGLNVNDVIVANTEKEIGQDQSTQYRNWATPEGAVVLLRALHERRGLSEQSQRLLLKLMTETPTGLKRLKGLLPASAIVAHKTGTSGTVNGVTAATNDVGIITLPNGRHIAIAVFVSDSKADDATREEVIAKVAQAAWNYWSR